MSFLLRIHCWLCLYFIVFYFCTEVALISSDSLLPALFNVSLFYLADLPIFSIVLHLLAVHILWALFGSRFCIVRPINDIAHFCSEYYILKAFIKTADKSSVVIRSNNSRKFLLFTDSMDSSWPFSAIFFLSWHTDNYFYYHPQITTLFFFSLCLELPISSLTPEFLKCCFCP